MVASCGKMIRRDGTAFTRTSSVAEKEADGRECGRPKFTMPSGKLSPMCYWHRIARTPMNAQIREADKRLAAAREPHRKRVPEAFWPPLERWCAGCQAFVPLWYCTGSRCRACAARSRQAQHREKTYGLGQEGYDALNLLQGGKCAICRKRQLDRAIAVDHDHKTGAVRGLLCKRCNHDLLGAAFDSLAILEAAVRYLRTPPTGGNWVPPEESEA